VYVVIKTGRGARCQQGAAWRNSYREILASHDALTVRGQREPACFTLPTKTSEEGNLMRGQSAVATGKDR
jgi:hypothetical protein